MRACVWLRRDLRLADHAALSAAVEDCSEVCLVYLATPVTWKRHHKSEIQQTFIQAHLHDLLDHAKALGFGVVMASAPTFNDCVLWWQHFVQQNQISAIYLHEEYEVDEQQRDQQVVAALKALECEVHSFRDRMIFAAEQVLNQKQQAFKVFTPFKKAWLRLADSQNWQAFNVPKPRVAWSGEQYMDVASQDTPLDYAIGEQAAHQKLQQFCAGKLSDYAEARDFPSRSGTSELSPYLAQGVLTSRQCIAALLETMGVEKVSQLVQKSGAEVWLSELIWREFYQYLLCHFPNLCRGKPFQAYTNQIAWVDDDALFAAWCEGRTGFPLVDAAMRQLLQTGWMHNRLRMLVAMVLSKLMLIDWRRGETFFMQHLVDGDFAANNGGWQWAASTGTDAAPYFRIFNPYAQSERFDPDGVFIRQYCPELKECDAKTIHCPTEEQCARYGYPLPIIDYQNARQRAIAAFKAAKDGV